MLLYFEAGADKPRFFVTPTPVYNLIKSKKILKDSSNSNKYLLENYSYIL